MNKNSSDANADISKLNLPIEIELLLRFENIDSIDELIKCSKEELLDILKDKKHLLILETVLKNNDFKYISNYGTGEWIYNGNENNLGD